MKKLLSLLLILVLVFSLAACGSSTKKEEPKDDTAKEKTEDKTEEKVEEKTDDKEETKDTKPAEKRVALVTDTGGIDDKSFNQSTWEGIERFNKETGIEITYAQSNSDADYIPNLSTFAEDGYTLIVAPGFLFADSMAEVSNNFPEQPFLIIDSVVADRPNVASAVFAENEGSFLVGVAAGKAALDAGKTKVGFIGGGDFELIWGFEAGFEAGVKAAAPDVEVLQDYVGDFVDAGKGQSIASKMYDQGAYVIFHAAGGAGNGLLKEAKDRRLSGEDVWAIGVDKDQYADGIYEGEKSAILTSMLKRVDVAAYTVADQAAKGEFPGGQILSFTLANNGVGIPEENPNLSEDIVNAVKEFSDKVVAGEIEVPKLPTRKQ